MGHFRASPGLTLGVIAASPRQQNRILDELEAQRSLSPDLEGFFKEDLPERFFVKNLENVQGDERDAIILSVGYGPDAAGKVAMRFGPLNRQGGERRLNVAVTRARASMAVVASLTSADIDLSRTQARGPALLRAFLDYAERGPKALAEGIPGASAGEGADGFDSPFEREVFDELRRRGLTLHTQVGCGGFRIDMAVVDPAAGGRYLLGVECDGATYHSSATARDRDRLRQAVLEGLGWRLCRVWSTDWLRNRERQVQRVLSAVAAAAHPADAPAVGPADPAPTTPAREPAAVGVAAPHPLTYTSIENVPERVIRAEVLSAVVAYGATGAGDLCGSVSRRLGFKRLGAKIKDRIESCLDSLTREGKLEREAGGRVKAAGDRPDTG
jgi:very-short-patch-repair endonuclease